MKDAGESSGVLVPSRSDLVSLLKRLSNASATDVDFEQVADMLRKIFRQPGSDSDTDLSLLPLPHEGWEAQPEGSAARDIHAVLRKLRAFRRSLESLPSRAWQTLDAAEHAHHVTSEGLSSDHEEPSEHDLKVLTVRELLELLRTEGERVEHTLGWAEAMQSSGDRFRSVEFASTVGEAYEIVTGKRAARRYDAHRELEYGPFLEFVVALKMAFNHPSSANTIARRATETAKRRRSLYGRSHSKPDADRPLSLNDASD